MLQGCALRFPQTCIIPSVLFVSCLPFEIWAPNCFCCRAFGPSWIQTLWNWKFSQTFLFISYFVCAFYHNNRKITKTPSFHNCSFFSFQIVFLLLLYHMCLCVKSNLEFIFKSMRLFFSSYYFLIFCFFTSKFWTFLCIDSLLYFYMYLLFIYLHLNLESVYERNIIFVFLSQG